MENEHFKNYDPPGPNQPLMLNEKNPKLLEEHRSPKDFADGAVYKPTVSMEDVVIKQPAKYIGLTKEELQRYANDPFWRRLRWFLLILFWLAWIAMFAAAIIIVAMSPKCPPKPSLKWWQKKVCYQMWTKSFQDSNNDGIGDVNGITQRVKQLAAMKFQSIWPVPLLQTGTGNGYDVINYKEIDPQVGTMDDVAKLIAETHKYSMKFVMDIPLTVVSDKHEWFDKSAKKDPHYIDYFIWQNNPQTIPQHWSQYGTRFYFHWKSSPHFAVLNWANEQVKKSMEDVLKFWLDKGVDGFYFGKVEYLSINPDNDQTDWKTVHAYLGEIANFTRNYVDRELLLFTSLDLETSAPSEKAVHLENHVKGNLNVIINKQLVNISQTCGAECIYDKLKEVDDLHYINNNSYPMWEIGNPYVSRVATRMGSRERGELMNMLLLTLPGSINTYYGDELGMEDFNKTASSPSQSNYFHENYQRTAMQWNGESRGGFSNADISLGPAVNHGYNEINFDNQMKLEKSPAKMYRRLAGLRNTDEAFLYGPMVLGPKNDSLVTLIRNSVTGTAPILCVLNFGNAGKFDLTHHFVGANITLADKDISAVITTTNLGLRNIYQERASVDVTQLFLMPNEGIVLKLKPKK